MRTNHRFFAILAGLAVVSLTVLTWQRHTAAALRGEIAGQRAQATERTQLQAEHQRLAATHATAEELEALLAERAAVAKLRTELETMKRRVHEAAAAPRPSPAGPPPETPPLAGHALAFHLWKNAGQATPAAAFESVLWASAAGDIDGLVKLLALDPDARNQASALFAQLPEAMRKDFVSPERLIAFLTAKDVPLGSATILNQYSDPTETKVVGQIFDAEGQHKISLFSLRAEGDRWRLVVPVNAVKRYATWLRAPPSITLSPVTTVGNP